tara:strand:- start:77 stop:802 length:726 start_codon:yes stop_codon:yes gene_type:complete
MAQYSINTIEPETTITATELNSAFAGLKDNTDGTTSKIDTTNVGAGGITRQHLASDAVHAAFVFSEIGDASTTTAYAGRTSGTGSAATAWTDVLTLTLSATPTLVSGDVLRYHFNLLIGDTIDSGNAGAGSGTWREQQLYYLRVVAHYTDSGGGDTEITPAYGYGLNQRSTNQNYLAANATQGLPVAMWRRNPVTGIWINRVANRVFDTVRLQLKFNVNGGSVANRVDIQHCNGFAVIERL